MRKVTKIFLLIAGGVLGFLSSAGAYSLAGPPPPSTTDDSWQLQEIGYSKPWDLNTPKNLGEEYRRNTPVLFYTFDQSFLDFYGTAGMAAVHKAFTMLNTAFTNSPSGTFRGIDGYSADLHEFPLESRHRNYQAQALGIIDMTSMTFGLLMEQLGLADPVRYSWTLHDRWLPSGGACPPDMQYLVVQRNFDYISSPLNQLQYSAYVNDVLYSYNIVEFCANTPWLAYTVPFSTDPLADKFSPVASYANGTLYYGAFFTGLTRDDAAGLRYLMSTNNVNFEDVSADSLLYTITTNDNPTVFPPYVSGGTNFVSGTNSGYYVFTGTTNSGYGYGDLTAFLAFAKTNPPAAVLASYPGVVITSVTNSATIVSNATIISYYTNAPVGSPYGSPPVLVVRTNYDKVFQVLYYYKFANVFTNHYTMGYQRLITTTVTAPIGAPYGSGVITNVTSKKIPVVSADFFVLPPFYTNVCPIDILPYGSITTVLATTNFTSLALTNSTTTNFTSVTYLVNYFTNYSYLIDPVTCDTVAGASGYYQGIEKIQFVYVPWTNYDTLRQAFNQPVTNNYTLIMVTNGLTQVQHLQRVVTTPDFVFSAADLTSGPGAGSHPIINAALRTIQYDQNHLLPIIGLAGTTLAGPGTITSPTLPLRPNTMTFNKSGPVYYNTPSSGMDGTPYFTETPENDFQDIFYRAYFVIGSFDGSTNAPVVYPNGTSIDNLDHQVLTQISPLSVPNGALYQSYPAVQFSASGGAIVGSLTWAGTSLPPGLSVSPSGVLSGTPTATGTYYFTVTLTDSNDLSVQYNYTIMIQ